jgi:hypothetical protein
MSVAERLQRRTQKQAPSKQVRLRLVYIDFWSVVKLSFLIWAVLAVVLVVATAMIWTILYSTGIFGKLDELFRDILIQPEFSIESSFGMGQVLLFAIVIGIVISVVGTILGALGAVLYNLSVRLTGGLLVGFQNN